MSNHYAGFCFFSIMEIQNNASLLYHNTLRIDATASVFAEYDNVPELLQLLVKYKGEKFVIEYKKLNKEDVTLALFAGFL